MARKKCEPDSSAAMVTSIRARPPENQDLSPSGWQETGNGTHPAYPAGSRHSFSRAKQLTTHVHLKLKFKKRLQLYLHKEVKAHGGLQ